MLNLTDRLEALAESDAPPMILDLDRAVATGRRRRQRRRSSAVAAVAALAVTGTLIASTLIDSTDNRPAPATPEPINAPLVTKATFGWLPPGVNRTDLAVGEHGDYARAENDNDKSGLGTQLWLSVHPAGKIPDVELGPGKLGRVPAEPVNGRTAYWATAASSDPLNGGDAVLLWEAEDGRWAQLHAYYLKFFEDPKAVLHRIATEAEVTDRAQPLPVRISGIPDTYRIYEATLGQPMRRMDGTGRFDLALFYTMNGANFSIHAFPAGTKRNKYGAKACRVEKAVEVCVVTEFTKNKAIRDLGGPQGILRHFVPLGMDKSHWETGER